MPSTQVQQLHETAVGFIKSEDWPLALTALEELLTEAPNDVSLLYRRGAVLVRLGDLEAAEADFARVLEVRPQHSRALAASKYVKRELARRRGQSAGASVTAGKSTAKVPPLSGDRKREPAQQPNCPASELPPTAVSPAVEQPVRPKPDNRPTPWADAPPRGAGASESARGTSAAADSAARDACPWETPAEIWAMMDEYVRRGLVQQYPCECSATVNRLTAFDVKSEGCKADVHIFPDAIAVLEREPLALPWWLCLLIRAFLCCVRGALFLVSLPLRIIADPFACIAPLALILVAAIACAAVFDVASKAVGDGLGLVLALVVIGTPVAFFVVIPRFGRHLGWWRNFVTKLIRNNPKAWYAIALLHRYTPLIPRLFRRGDVVQLIRCEAKTGWLSGRSLLAFVQDRPLRRRPSLLDVLALPILPRRRIYYVALDGGEDAAEGAARATAEALGIEISRASFHKRKGMQLV